MSDAAMKPVFTTKGLAAAAAAHGRGLSLKLTHLPRRRRLSDCRRQRPAAGRGQGQDRFENERARRLRVRGVVHAQFRPGDRGRSGGKMEFWIGKSARRRPEPDRGLVREWK